MKTIFKFAILCAAASAAFCSCRSEKDMEADHHYTNKVFLSIGNVSEEILVKAGAKDVTRTMKIATAMPVEKEVTAMLTPDYTLVADFRKEFAMPDAMPLPEENCEIEDARLVLAKGSCTSSEASLSFVNLGTLDTDLTYVLPVSIKHVGGDVPVLASKDHFYYIFKGAALINVVCNMTDNRAGAEKWATPEKFTNMSQFTCEALVRQNKAPNMISTIMGVEGHYLLRIGDAGIPNTQLQIASSSNQTNNKMTFPAGKWVHVACVFNAGKTTVYFDGRKVLDNVNSGRTSVTWGAYGNDPGESNGRYFWLGYSYASDRYLDGELSEVRIWDHCLTEEEINAPNHFYAVDPESAGLTAYWKMDEGSGTVLKDSSPNGNDLTLKNKTSWPKVSLPETK